MNQRSPYILALALTISACAIEMQAKPDDGLVTPELVAENTTEPPKAVQAYERFAVGIGYPDLRARLALGYGVDAEAKSAFGDGIQAYSARLIWNYADLGPLKFTAGAEGGYVRFDGVQGISGTGALASGFLGIEYPFVKRLRLSVDAGPAWLQGNSEGQSYSTTDLVFNSALYFYLF